MNSFTLKSNRDTFNGLENIIKCYISLDKIKNPCMCPCCKKLTCKKCIQKWLVEKKINVQIVEALFVFLK